MMYPAVGLGSASECGSSNEGEGSGGGGSNELEDGAANTQAQGEEATNQNSPTELVQ